MFYPKRGFATKQPKTLLEDSTRCGFPKARWRLALWYTGKQRLSFPQPQPAGTRDKAEPRGTWQGSEQVSWGLSSLALWSRTGTPGVLAAAPAAAPWVSRGSAGLRAGLSLPLLGATSWAHQHCLSAPNHKPAAQEKEAPVVERGLVQQADPMPAQPSLEPDLSSSSCLLQTPQPQWYGIQQH